MVAILEEGLFFFLQVEGNNVGMFPWKASSPRGFYCLRQNAMVEITYE